MKTIKIILMIALFSMITISCTDLDMDDFDKDPTIENVLSTGNSGSNTPPPPPPADGTGEENTGEDGSGKGNG